MFKTVRDSLQFSYRCKIWVYDYRNQQLRTVQIVVLCGIPNYRHLPVFYYRSAYTGWAKKSKATNSWPWVCQILTDFQFFVVRFLGKFVVKWLFKNPTIPCICCHATLWNVNVRKQAVNDKLQSSVATYLRCGGFVNLPVKNWKSVKICQNYGHEIVVSLFGIPCTVIEFSAVSRPVDFRCIIIGLSLLW